MASGAFSTTMAHNKFFEIVSKVSCSYLSMRPSHSMSLFKNSEVFGSEIEFEDLCETRQCLP